MVAPAAAPVVAPKTALVYDWQKQNLGQQPSQAATPPAATTAPPASTSLEPNKSQSSWAGKLIKTGITLAGVYLAALGGRKFLKEGGAIQKFSDKVAGVFEFRWLKGAKEVAKEGENVAGKTAENLEKATKTEYKDIGHKPSYSDGYGLVEEIIPPHLRTEFRPEYSKGYGHIDHVDQKAVKAVKEWFVDDPKAGNVKKTKSRFKKSQRFLMDAMDKIRENKA